MKVSMKWREVEVSGQRYDQEFDVPDDFVVTPASLRELAIDADPVDGGKNDGCEVVAYEVLDYSMSA